MNVDKDTLDQLALSVIEYKTIVERLGREPNYLELGLFGSLWSEHCGYNHSKPLLKMFASDNPKLLVSLGEENAGVVNIGDNLAVVFKIESHNHPSAVDPYQGAATGVGGIVRDIFAMGARPVALLNSLRFGPLDEDRNRFLFDGVVSGISAYGNCLGIPDVGGEVVFSHSYSGNPLVNAMCVGILEPGDLVRSTSGKSGNLLIMVGAGTGRDGIHGASGLASRTLEEDRELRPSVQVGNPFLEKVLIEACLEVARANLIVGMQDLGAAGLTSAVVECAANGGTGVELDVAKIPKRDSGMQPYELMLSESQERMLLVLEEHKIREVEAVFDKWDLALSVIGRVTDDGMARIVDDGKVIGEVPVALLMDPPLYRPNVTFPKSLKKLQTFNLESLSLLKGTPNEMFLDLLASPNIASKEFVYRRYDHQVQTNTLITPGGDAAVIRIRNTGKALAVSVDGNGRYCYLDPYVGGMIAVAEACRNISCAGAEPLAITNCLNFGDPERSEVYYQLEGCVRGMAHASAVLDVPVVSGNVSLYNETRRGAIYPTPIVGAVGLISDTSLIVSPGFKDAGDLVMLLGASTIGGESAALAGSEYIELRHGLVVGSPVIDIDAEVAVQSLCRTLVRAGVAKSAHDCSDGGLAICLAESCVAGNIGLKCDYSYNGRWDAALFGEQQSRIVVSISPDSRDSLIQQCKQVDVPWCELGVVGGDSVTLGDVIHLPVAQIADAWKNGLHRATL